MGPWRLLGLTAEGSYGVVFRAERAASPGAGVFALKLARQPEDPRFALEVELLSRVEHPNVPRLHDSGEWAGPEGALHPFLVMDWVEGLPLYSWARIQRLSSRQVLRLLAQLARALQAVHAAGGLHRDVKGTNVLVRAADGQALLADFGSCTWRGAPVLTRQSHPPGTPQYASPQAQLHQWKFRRFASARYEASPADDVYALGVTAYRLVAGRYPLIAEAQEAGEEDLFSRFPALVPVEELAQLSPELARWIGQMLSEKPEARGTAAELALGLELAANTVGSEADQPIRSGKPPARGLPEAITREAREAPPVQAPRSVVRRRWPAALLVMGGGLAASMWCVWQAKSGASSEVSGTDAAAPEGETTGLGEVVLTQPLSAPEPLPTSEGIAEEVPKEPLPGQRLPPCKKPQVKIHGSCWIPVADEAPPCIEDTYEWKRRCYVPFFGPPLPATSGQKKKPQGLSDP
ncbi:serine/threonine-protein kinase [Hyalangium rubrum]|uniref:non-specific serine/threonine protein kinase n=1 Tax=Hyalangium rubrum TaxID=3103134 RepID=A0ABU5HJL6_9BACT|nr:protein kinase [Hyalangium sp. s54d21]MDY7233347.1 protein kinase [Hyalangium sp. s54d21]